VVGPVARMWPFEEDAEGSGERFYVVGDVA
jgi:hypothetical protein